MTVVALAGHVDHGKTTLVRALTGTDPDRLAEEKRRGLTLDLGFAWTDVEGRRISFVDVPGHERYVATMLAGLGPVQAALLVVSAAEGWRAQTGEHAEALAAFQVRGVVVAITHSDLADPGPVAVDVSDRLTRAGVAHAAPVAVSALTGDGIAALRSRLVALAASVPAPDPALDARLWIDRSFTIVGAGTVVTGTLDCGHLRVGDLVTVAGHRRLRVRALESSNARVEVVSAPARVAVNLAGIAVTQVRRGDLLTTGDPPSRPTVLRARPVTPIDRLPSHLVVHVGSAAIPARARRRSDGAVVLRAGGETPFPAVAGDRLALRDPGRHVIIGGAVVLADGAAAPSPKTSSAAGSPTAAPPALAALAAWLQDNPLRSPPEDERRRWSLSAQHLADGERAGMLLRLDGQLLAPDSLAMARGALDRMPPRFSPGDFARALGCSRAVALALLGRLDGQTATIRHADGTRTARGAHGGGDLRP